MYINVYIYYMIDIIYICIHLDFYSFPPTAPLGGDLSEYLLQMPNGHLKDVSETKLFRGMFPLSLQPGCLKT